MDLIKVAAHCLRGERFEMRLNYLPERHREQFGDVDCVPSDKERCMSLKALKNAPASRQSNFHVPIKKIKMK